MLCFVRKQAEQLQLLAWWADAAELKCWTLGSEGIRLWRLARNFCALMIETTQTVLWSRHVLSL